MTKQLSAFSTRLPQNIIDFLKIQAIKEGKKLQDYVLSIFMKVKGNK